MITVVGCDGGAASPAAAAALTDAKLIIGAPRHLSTIDTVAETLPLGNVDAAVRHLTTYDGPAVVLASGDPGFFGIVRALRRAGLRPEVLPGVSSVAHAFARIGLPWDDALVVSAHGRDLRRAVNACRAYRKVAVLTGPGAGPVELSRALDGLPRRLIVASRLGAPDEQVGPLTERADWPSPHVVICLGPARDTDLPWIAGRPPGPPEWALPESAFTHRGSMITKAEVRALVLARLGPRPGDLVWDVGAGSGSVAVECARLGAATVAVDRDPEATVLIGGNAHAFDVDVQVVTGAAPEVLNSLPDPDAVFVGGGGLPVLAACVDRRPARLVTAMAAVDRVGPSLATLHSAGYDVEGTQLQSQRLSPLPDGTHRLAATNPVFVLWGTT